MTAKHTKPAHHDNPNLSRPATDSPDHRPASSEQAPAGAAHEPAPQDGWTGNPDPGLPADHSAEVKAEGRHHAHKDHVEMHKDGVTIHVHPETVEAHHAAGWQRA